MGNSSSSRTEGDHSNEDDGYVEEPSSNASASASGELDLVFVCDCTSSMSGYITAAQNNIREIVEEITSFEKADVRFALVEYRDHPPQDRTYVFRVNKFTTSVKTMKGYVDNMSAEGGGDGPEAVACALKAALTIGYRKNAAKVVVLIADAPPHGLDPSGSSGDGFPNGCPCGVDPIDVARKMAKRGIVIYPVAVEPSLGGYKYARDFMRALAKITDGQLMPLGNPKLLGKAIIGGAAEEVSMEQLMEKVNEEVERERQQYKETSGGAEMADEEVARRVTEKLQEQKVETTQLKIDSLYEGTFDDCNLDMMVSTKSLKTAAKKFKTPKSEVTVKQEAIAPSYPGGLSLSYSSVRSEGDCEDISVTSSCDEMATASPSYSRAALASPAPMAERECAQEVSYAKSAISYDQVSRMMSKAKKRGL